MATVFCSTNLHFDSLSILSRQSDLAICLLQKRCKIMDGKRGQIHIFHIFTIYFLAQFKKKQYFCTRKGFE